jgi:hypothetical protein
MRMRREAAVLAAALVAAGAAKAVVAQAAPTAREMVRRDFDSDAAAGVPGFFRFEGTPGLAPEKWKAIPDPQALSRPMTAVQTDATGQPGHFHFALSTRPAPFLDGSVEAATKRAASKGFARGGVAIRYRSPGDFVAALVDFGSQTVSVLAVRGGKAETLGAAPIRSNEPLWRTIRLSAEGDRLEVWVSRQKVIDARDPHPQEGAAGLVAEAPVPVAFDDMEIVKK